MLRRIGAGSFGEIYNGEDENGVPVAIKLERVVSPDRDFLLHEADLYKQLQGNPGIPEFYWYGTEAGYNVLVIEKLGKSIEDLLRVDCGGRLGLRTVLMIANRMLTCIEHLHIRGIVHRDLKPDNFMIGREPSHNSVYLIDFGLSASYIDEETGEHVKMRKHRSLTGTARYASINAMELCEHSRRDDLESLGYILVYLLKGSLPWQGIPATDGKSKTAKIAEMKAAATAASLCRDIPRQFEEYLEMTRGLAFMEEPPYETYRAMFKDLFDRSGFVDDNEFTWERQPELPPLSPPPAATAAKPPVEAGQRRNPSARQPRMNANGNRMNANGTRANANGTRMNVNAVPVRGRPVLTRRNARL